MGWQKAGADRVIARAQDLNSLAELAWHRGQEVVVHGWVYGLHNGLLEDLSMTVTGPDSVPAAYQAALDALKARHGARTTA